MSILFYLNVKHSFGMIATVKSNQTALQCKTWKNDIRTAG